MPNSPGRLELAVKRFTGRHLIPEFRRYLSVVLEYDKDRAVIRTHGTFEQSTTMERCCNLDLRSEAQNEQYI